LGRVKLKQWLEHMRRELVYGTFLPMADCFPGYIVTIDCCLFATLYFDSTNDIVMIQIGMPYARNILRQLQRDRQHSETGEGHKDCGQIYV